MDIPSFWCIFYQCSWIRSCLPCNKNILVAVHSDSYHLSLIPNLLIPITPGPKCVHRTFCLLQKQVPYPVGENSNDLLTNFKDPREMGKIRIENARSHRLQMLQKSPYEQWINVSIWTLNTFFVKQSWKRVIWYNSYLWGYFL